MRPGDILHSLDTPATAGLDEGSMVALMQQTQIEMEVYRDGAPLTLRHALNTDDPGPTDDGR